MENIKISEIVSKLDTEDQNTITALIAEKDDQIEYLMGEVEHYKRLFALRNKDKFCVSSEQDNVQMTIFDEVEVGNELSKEEEIVEKIEIAKGKAPKKQKKSKIPENAKVVEKHYTMEESDTVRDIHSDCVKRSIKIIPAQLIVLEEHVHVYAVTQPDGSVILVRAKSDRNAFSSTDVDCSVVSHIIYEKYSKHSPLYRIEKDYQLQGYNISRKDMCNYIAKADDVLHPLVDEIAKYVRNADVNHADETTMTVIQLDKDNGKAPKERTAKTNSYVWGFSTGKGYKPAIVLQLGPTRKAEVPIKFFENSSVKLRYLQTDGLEQYRNVPGVVNVGCYQHANRKFRECVNKNTPKDSVKQKILDYFKLLYHIDSQIQDSWGKDYDTIKQLRLKLLKPKFDELSQLIHRYSATSKGKFAEAVQYFINNEPYFLNVFLDGRLELTNNYSEREAMKPFVLGRKNWLFSFSKSGAVGSCDMFSLILTAKLNGINPFVYLDYLLRVLPEEAPIQNMIDYSQYLPWNKDLRAKLVKHAEQYGQIAITKKQDDEQSDNAIADQTAANQQN